MKLRIAFCAVALIALCAAAAPRLAPYLFAEIAPYIFETPAMAPVPARLSRGRMLDSYFSVEPLGNGDYAIGEPRNFLGNYAYLIVGKARALLFDAGTGTGDIRAVVARLTSLPVTIIPSHLHFDHIGGIHTGDRVALINLPSTRHDARGNLFRPGRYEYLSTIGGSAPTFPVAEWIRPGADLDLGGRSLRLISTPGHTVQSVSLYDETNHRIFVGDFLYPGMLYAFLPGHNLDAYLQTTRRLRAMLPADTRLWTAHCCRKGETGAAPWLTISDLADLERTLITINAGKAEAKGFFPRTYRVNDQMDISTAWFRS